VESPVPPLNRLRSLDGSSSTFHDQPSDILCGEYERWAPNPNSRQHHAYMETNSPDYPPITAEDLAKLGIESRLIPFIVSTTLQAGQSPNDLPPPSPTEADNLVEVLDKVCLHL